MRTKTTNSRYRPGRNHLTINWGNSTLPTWWDTHPGQTLNHPAAVAIACNKYSTLHKLTVNQGVSVPDWTTDKTLAEDWIEDGHKVFCRTTLTGTCGRGIIIASSIDELVDAPLYVQAVKKDIEYRVHVFGGEVIDYQQKKKKHGFTGGVPGIRNHSNGWVFARSDVDLPAEVAEQSIKAVSALGLDFGAVDICTSTDGNVYVFEVNTAPGLEGTTLQKYTGAIQRRCNV